MPGNCFIIVFLPEQLDSVLIGVIKTAAGHVRHMFHAVFVNIKTNATELPLGFFTMPLAMPENCFVHVFVDLNKIRGRLDQPLLERKSQC